MNSVLKTHLLSLIDPTWESGRSGTVVVCYAKYVSREGVVRTQQFKEKAWYRSSYEKSRRLYQAMRCFFIEMDTSAKGDMSRYQGYKLAMKYIAHSYRLAAVQNAQYVSECYLEYDARRAPNDRLGCFLTIIGGDSTHE